MSKPRRLSAKAALALLQQEQEDSDAKEEESDFEIDEEDCDSDDEMDDSHFEDRENSACTTAAERFDGMTSRDGTQWTCSSKKPKNSRVPPKNILRHRGGPKQFILTKVNDEMDIFHELFGPSTLESILKNTLAEAKRQGFKDFTLTLDELTAFLGLAIIRGVTKGKNEPLSSFWDTVYGASVFRETMARNKFTEILKFLRFDDKDTRESRRASDKFAPIRSLWNTVMDNCQKCFFPNGSVTIDEQLFSCKSRCSFTQYMPQKPGKFGLKFWLVCDAKTSYVLRAEPYTGSDEQRQMPLGEHVVMNLMEPYFQTGLNVTCDNFFTSLRVARNLLQHKITIVGTVRPNRREIPEEMQMRREQLHTSKFAFSVPDNIMLTSYKAKQKKTVFVLSSLHDCAKVDTSTEKKKPEVILYYNSEKGGVDTADQMLRCYSSKAASRRWPLAAFFNLLDIVCLNSFIISIESGIHEENRRKFLLKLGEKLCKSERSRRTETYPFRRMLEVGPSGDQVVLPPGKRTTCRKCQTNKTRESCCCCHTFACGTCTRVICNDCL